MIATTTNKQRWLYSIANIGNTIPYQAVGAVVLFYYTDVKRLPATWAATVMTIYAIYNAFNNPVMGYLSDRTRTRWGRRIPYILFGTVPYALAFALLFFAPFDGRENAVSLLIYFAVGLFIWEGLGTAVSTAYYSLLPEMFREYNERTDVAMRMNIVQTVGLLIGAALPAYLGQALGWPLMGVIFAVIAAAAMYTGLPGMFERREVGEQAYFDLWTALKTTLVNRSFITVVIAQTMRFFATNTLAAGMVFYMKYSLGADPGLTSLVLASAFVAAGLAMWPWRQFIAKRFDPRTTLMLAYAMIGLAVLPLGFVTTLGGAIFGAVLVGIALAGLIFMGDVILSDVVDEDQVKTGLHRAGMYFGMSGLIITLSSALVSIVFGLLLPAYGYNTALDVQPATVGVGFRIFMTVPPMIGALLALAALYFYPLHGKRLKEVKEALAKSSAG
ncbi:MAG: MFS transporter [Anaerolineales bacterium]|nr:MFS transporter [Anaerolineales bacterium]